MKKMISLAVTLAATAALAMGPSFHETPLPTEWTVGKGQAVSQIAIMAADGKTLDLQTTNLLAGPVEAMFRFRAAPGGAFGVRVIEEQKDAKPRLEFTFEQQADNHARIEVKSGGAPMATSAKSARRWDYINKNTGTLDYKWRFPHVKTLWDERDYREIGAANDQLIPLDEKSFTLRMMLAASTRQIWLDDRLVAEDRVGGDKPARWAMHLTKGAQVLSAEFSTPTDAGNFLPLALEHYSNLKNLQGAKADSSLIEIKSIPIWVPKAGVPDINLGDSLERYRLTHGSGPDTGFMNAWASWPGAFDIDPASLTFRVPYRNYQNAWLLAWVEDRPNAVAKGTFRFFGEGVGYPASANWEISPEAIKQGSVTQLKQKTADGKQLYLVKVPMDTEGMHGMIDREDQFLNFELCKPVAMMRSYPDPIFYGDFPAGLPSSLHVVGITLEEAPFGITVTPKQAHYIFVQPEKPVVTVSVTNTTAKSLDARVRAETVSYDGGETNVFQGRASVQPGQSSAVVLTLDVKKRGYHDLQITTEAGGMKRAAALSLVLLAPDTRTRGTAVNENRFGMWNLVGHYVSCYDTVDKDGLHEAPSNDQYWEAYQKLGLSRLDSKHSVGRNFASWNRGDSTPESRQKAIEGEVGSAKRLSTQKALPLYFYGGEWGIGSGLESQTLGYGSWPIYTGQGELPLSDEVRKAVGTQIEIFTAIGQAIHTNYPQVQRLLQWGAPAETIAFLRMGVPKDIVDGFGIDAPMFELLPEVSNASGCINLLWQLRAEAKRLGWPRLPIGWTEGPFFPTNPGGLTERDQMDYQVRYMLLGMSYGVDYFTSGVVPQDAGNYYGTEHYGAGIIHRKPLENPKPAAAAVATMTAMLCGADPVGGLDTGCLTTYCMEFQRAKTQAKFYALWRVRGTQQARIKVRGSKAVLTDAMGNATPATIKDGAIQVVLSASPVWLTEVDKVEGFELAAPSYESAPANVTRPLAEMTAENWTYDGSEDKDFAHHSFAVYRTTDPNLTTEFGKGEEGHMDAAAVTLAVEPGDRPGANRYGALKPRKAIAIPGKPSALGLWVKGNSSWGRIIYQLRDAKGQIWTAAGTKDDWNCDDTHNWSYVNFEGWRYLRFPLPGNAPYDAARDLETTWWGSRGGDGVVALPLTVDKIIVEARNEVPVLGEMKIIPERSYKLSQLVAEYATESDATPAAVAQNQLRPPESNWTGPAENPIAKLAVTGVADAPIIKGFDEPLHFNDGRQMHIRFNQDPGLKYNLYVSRYADGRGADLLQGSVTDNQLVGGMRPELKMYMFLTSVGADKKESKPSKPCELITHDNFFEK